MRRFIYGLVALLIAATGVAFADSIITGSKPFTFTPGTVISSSQVNANFDYIINQTNTNAAKNGVNSSITALTGLTTPINPTQGGSRVYTSGTAGGTANALTISATVPAISSYSVSNSNLVTFIAATTNTATGPTLNVNGTGAFILSKVTNLGIVDARPGEIAIGNMYLVYNTGTRYIVINMPRLFGGRTDLASATTTDLGLVGSHYVNVTGTTTITSFGSSANLAEPVYLVRFASALSITPSANIVTPGGGNLTTSPGDSAWLIYAGSGVWSVIDIIYNNPFPAIPSVNSLGITNNSGTPNTQLDITSSFAVLASVGNAGDLIGGLSVTLNAAVNGVVNGLDTGALAANTWYHVYLISDGASLSGTLLSLSATTPTLPAGYVYRYRVGAVRTGAASTFLRTFQRGRRTQYQVIAASTTPNLPIMSSGATGNVATPTYTSIATGNFVPPTATEISVTAYSNGVYILAPNNAYGVDASTTNPPFSQNGGFAGGAINMMLDSTNIFWANNSAVSVLACNGWIDAVNAN